MHEQRFQDALEHVWVVVRGANAYIAAQEPWALRKTDPDRMATVLYVAMEAARHIVVLLQPFMPDSCAALLDQLGVPSGARTFDRLGADGALAPGGALPAPAGVFPRYAAEQAAE